MKQQEKASVYLRYAEIYFISFFSFSVDTIAFSIAIWQRTYDLLLYMLMWDAYI